MPAPTFLRRIFLARLALAALGGTLPAYARGPARLAPGQMLPDVLLKGLNGAPRRLASYRGKPLLINVWASWCGPCVEEMASLERLAWTEARTPFAMIGISTDDYAERARALLERTHASISHFIDQDLQMETLLGADKIPLTVLVDARGRLLERVQGAREWDAPETLRMIERVFAQSPAGLQRS